MTSAVPEVMLTASEASKFALQSNLDHVWTMTAAGLVFFMQAGFLLLESGLVRSKNSINVAQKNITDFVCSTIMFGAFGFMIMFGATQGGWFGFERDLMMFNQVDDWIFTFFVFQLVFCGTAATIVSGATAERMKLGSYILLALLIGGLIYPVSGHWAWGNLLNSENAPWLANMGFMDFAGSTVVHSVGAWVALAALLVIGPRIGRYNADGSLNPINGHSAVLATLGCIILWVGWIGFNGGSTTAGTSTFAKIIANTMVAGAIGGAVQMFLGRWSSGLYRPEYSINGVLSGLVAITAGCDVVSIWGAITIGASASAVAYYAQHIMEHHLKIDDAIGAVPVHGVAGAWGTLAIAFIAPTDSLLAGGRFDQFFAQFIGIGAVFVWSFGTAYVALNVFKMFHASDPGGGLRVSPEDEMDGLNKAEHGVSLGTGILQESMKTLALGDIKLSDRIKVEHGDEAGELCLLFNIVMDRLERMDAARRKRRLHIEKTRRAFDKVFSSLSGEISHIIQEGLSELKTHSQTVSSQAQTINQQSATTISNSRNMNDHACKSRENVSSTRAAGDTLSEGMVRLSHDTRQAVSAMQAATDRSRIAAEAAEALHQAANEIEELTSIIASISHQTNLLALNATIEAEHAGEHGKGFAVVASEVKELASRTDEATVSVNERVGNVRQISEQLIESISQIGEVLKQSDQMGQTVESLLGQTNELTSRIHGDLIVISDATSEISTNAEETERASEITEMESATLERSSRDVSLKIDGLRERFDTFVASVLDGKDRRTFKRFDFTSEGVLNHQDEVLVIEMVDLSIDGFQLKLDAGSLSPGSEVRLYLEQIGKPLDAVVRYVDGLNVHCQFEPEACEDEALNQLIDKIENEQNLEYAEMQNAA